MTIPSLKFAAALLLAFLSPLGWTQDRPAPAADAAPITLSPLKSPNRFAHVVCSLRPLNEPNPDVVVFAEGDLCAAGGGRCVYHGLLNLGGDDIPLKQTAVNQRARTASFAGQQIGVTVSYPRRGPSTLTLTTPDKRVTRVKLKSDCAE